MADDIAWYAGWGGRKGGGGGGEASRAASCHMTGKSTETELHEAAGIYWLNQLGLGFDDDCPTGGIIPRDAKSMQALQTCHTRQTYACGHHSILHLLYGSHLCTL